MGDGEGAVCSGEGLGSGEATLHGGGGLHVCMMTGFGGEVVGSRAGMFDEGGVNIRTGVCRTDDSGT